MAFVRDLHRLGGGRDVVFHSHLLGHAACYRPGLGFMTRRFAEYFEPWAEDAADFEGTGSYSWYQGACGPQPPPCPRACARARVARGWPPLGLVARAKGQPEAATWRAAATTRRARARWASRPTGALLRLL